jgi:hypothetical protein
VLDFRRSAKPGVGSGMDDHLGCATQRPALGRGHSQVRQAHVAGNRTHLLAVYVPLDQLTDTVDQVGKAALDGLGSRANQEMEVIRRSSLQ